MKKYFKVIMILFAFFCVSACSNQESVYNTRMVSSSMTNINTRASYSILDENILNKLNPKYSLISVGENKFGHPNLYTLYLLRNTEILRTDVNNSIKLVVNKKGYRVLNFDISKKKYVKF